MAIVRMFVEWDPHEILYIYVFFISTAPSCSNAPPENEIRQSTKHYHAVDMTSFSF